ncbi:redoxin domain-containing protein [Halovenus salina]|uniref:Redoxin domain-containing protein n=1 Tax=Halovenus salina TaxID=1510225 RepID=A0ABD5W8L4_9EURY|nr:redoxin domain-containing protein [Halovenus salina]
MVSAGDDAPDFTAPLANGDTELLTLSDRLDDAPVVLAFFPGAFTSVCSHEMSTFEDRLDALTEHGATLFGVSIDTPFSLNEFRDELGLSFGLISDTNRDLVNDYDVATDFADIGVEDIAERAVFVIDGSGTVTYAWVGENAGVEPDYDEVEAAVEDAVAN